MRSGLSSVATLVAFSLAGLPAVAQLTVSSQLGESGLSDADFQKQFKDKQTSTVKVRPNGPDPIPYFVYAQNTHPAQDRTLVVELRGEAKGDLLAEGRAEKVPAGQWKVIRFTKPAALAAPAPPAPAPGAAAAAPTEPPPAGVPVARGAAGFALTLKLFDIDDKGARNEVKVAGKPYEQTLDVVFLNPTEYVTVGDLKGADKSASILLTPSKTGGKSTAKVTFPGQKDGLPPAGVVGLFAVTLDPAVDGGKGVKVGGLFPNGLVPVHLAIDGVERVAVYDPATSAADKSEVKALTDRRVRVVPLGVADVTKPTAAYPVRVETDNAKADDTLELRIRRKGDTVASDEVIPLGGPRDEKLWVDAAEPTKQGLGFTTKTTDWVKVLDLSAARGEMEVEAVLKPKGAPEKEWTKGPLKVIVDAEPPAQAGTLEVGDPTKPKEKLLKGAALPVSATVKDEGGAGVKQVTFLLFTKLQPDGTFPPDAVTADAVRLPRIDPKTKKPIPTEFTDVWAAELTPPADKKGKFYIATVAVDNAGNASKVTKQDLSNIKVIEIVDAAAGAGVPRGSIAGIVVFGGLPQPGLKVAVGGPDGKAKAVAETDAKGRFCIPDVVPGAYTVLTLKTDSNKGFSSQADVTVEPEKTAKVTLELIRNKDGR